MNNAVTTRKRSLISPSEKLVEFAVQESCVDAAANGINSGRALPNEEGGEVDSPRNDCSADENSVLCKVGFPAFLLQSINPPKQCFFGNVVFYEDQETILSAGVHQ